MINRLGIHLICLIMAFAGLIPATLAGNSGEIRALRTVVIDAGHGGHDPGAVSGGVREKDIVLDLALRLGKKISSAYPEVKVIYTRDKDIFIPLFQRASIANRNKADLFISLHANYVSSPSANGTETFTLGLHRSQENLEVAKKENSVILLEEDYSANYEGFDPREAESYIMFENLQSEYQGQSIDFAAHIQKYFGQNLNLTDRGVKQAGFLVLRQASMPSVLVEVGFISNPNERKFLVSDSGKEKITESIFQAFSTYKRTIDGRSHFNMAQTDPTSTGTTGNSNPAEAKPAPAASTQPPAERIQSPPAQSSPSNSPSPQAAKTSPGTKTQSRVAEKIPVPAPSTNKRWYSVQVAAGQKVIPTIPANFKGEKNITRIAVGNLNKYISGRFNSFDEARKERDRIKSKFPDAFVVVVDNGIPVLAKN
jgi:N-acetylmuramoyl-L-alanine amidase